MRALAEQVQMEIGMGTSFGQLHFEEFGTWKTETWLKTMWKNLVGLDIDLLWRYLPSLPLQREGCTYIMEGFLAFMI